jgi:GTPase SAR1 family protein
VSNDNVKLQIWDTAGQEWVRSISKSDFRNAVGSVLAYDITNLISFDQLADWLNDLQTLSAPNAYILLAGNKADLEKEPQLGGDLTKDFAERYHVETIETLALSGKNIKDAFARMGFEVLTRVSNRSIAVGPPPNRPVKPTPFADEQQKKNWKELVEVTNSKSRPIAQRSFFHEAKKL